MKILYISHYYYPERSAPVSRAMELCRVWRELGHEPIVLTGFPHFPSGKVVQGYRSRITQQESIDGVNVFRTWVLPAANRGILKRSLSFLSFAISAALFATFHNFRADVVVATSPQLFTGLAGFWVARLRRIPFVFEVRDLWPDSISALGVIKENFFIKGLRSIEKFLYAKADHIVTVTDHLRSEIIRKGVDQQRVSVFSNGANIDLFAPQVPDQDLAQQLNLTGKFVVSYIGNFANAYDFDLVLDVASRFERETDVVFFLAGSGIQFEKVKAQLKESGAMNVILHPSIERKQLPRYLALASVALVPLRDSEFFRGHRPCKTFEIMAMGKVPIIQLEGELRAILDGNDVALFETPGSAEALYQAIDSCRQSPDALLRMGKNARQFIIQHFAMRVIGQKYVEKLASLTQ